MSLRKPISIRNYLSKISQQNVLHSASLQIWFVFVLMCRVPKAGFVLQSEKRQIHQKPINKRLSIPRRGSLNTEIQNQECILNATKAK